MPDPIEPDEKIRSLVYSMSRSLANVMLEAGIGAKEYCEIAKAAFVDEAADKYASHGKPASMSEVARQTGLTRPEVKRLGGKFERLADLSRFIAPTREGHILGLWHTDARYLDEQGEPLALPASPGDLSIEGLIRRITSPELLDEQDRVDDLDTVIERLLSTGHVEALERGRYRPLRRNFSSDKDLAGIAVALDTSVVRSAKTIKHNLNAPAGNTWVQRMVSADHALLEDDLTLVRRSIRSRATSFCEDIDDLIAASKSGADDDGADPEQRRKIGIGLFYFEDEPDPG